MTKDFGTQVHNKMHFGGKYVWKPDKNPGPGNYQTNDKAIRPSKQSAVSFSKSEKGDRLGKASFLGTSMKNNPGAADYQNVKESISIKMKKMTIFGKYKEKANKNPAPGFYKSE